MKVALVCFRIDTSLSGVLQYSTELTTHLANEGIDVVRMANAPVVRSDVAYLRSTSDWNFTTKMSLRLAGFVRSEKVDLVHIIGGFPDSGILRRLAVPVVYQFFGGALVQSLRGVSIFQKVRGLGRTYRSSWVVNHTIKNTDHLIAHSERAMDVLINRYSVGRTRVSVVPISSDASIGFDATESVSSFTVLVLCDSYSKQTVLRALLEMDRSRIESLGVRVKVLCDYASYFTVLRTVKAKGLDDLVECIESRTTEDFLRECVESSGVIMPEMFISRDRLIAEAGTTGTLIINLMSYQTPSDGPLPNTSIDVLTMKEAFDYLYSVSSHEAKSVQQIVGDSWDHALPAIVNIYSGLLH